MILGQPLVIRVTPPMLRPAPQFIAASAQLTNALPSRPCEPGRHHSHCKRQPVAKEEADQFIEPAPRRTHIVRPEKNNCLVSCCRFWSSLVQTAAQPLAAVFGECSP